MTDVTELTEPSEAAHIEREMERLRQTLDYHAEGLVDSAKTLTDWKYYAKSHPWLFLGTAAAVGFLAVPKVPQKEMHVEKAAGWLPQRVVVKEPPQKQANRGVAVAILGLLANAVIKAGIGMATQKLSSAMRPPVDRQFQTMESRHDYE